MHPRVDKYLYADLTYAVLNCDVIWLSKLLQQPAEPCPDDKVAKQKEFIRIFQNSGIDPEEKDQYGKTFALRFMLEKRGRKLVGEGFPNYSFWATLAEATNKGNYNTTRYGEALQYAVQDDDYPSATRLLRANVNKNWQDGCGMTCLHHAILNRDVKMITFLLSFDYDLDGTNHKFGMTPRQFAAHLDSTHNTSKWTEALMQGWKNYRNQKSTVLKSQLCESAFFSFSHTPDDSKKDVIVLSKERLCEENTKKSRCY